MSNSLRGICVFGGRTGAATIPEQWKQGENRTARLAQSKASPIQERSEDAKRAVHNPDFSGRVSGPFSSGYFLQIPVFNSHQWTCPL